MPQSREEQLDRRGGAMPMRSLSADAVSHSFFYSTGDEAGDEDESSDQPCPTASSITSGTNWRHTSVDGEEDEDETNRLTRVMQRVANVAKNVPQRVGGRLAESHLLRRRGMDVKSSNLSAGTPHAHSPWYHYTSPIGMMSHSGSIPSSTGPSPLHRLRQRWHQRGSKSDFSAASLLSTKSSLYDVRNGIGRSSHRGAVGRVVGMRWNGPESADGDSLRSTSSFDPKLHFAVASGDVHAVLNMLEGGDGNVNQADYEGRTPLHVAASLQNIQMVEVLIRYKADVNATDRRNRTPLFDAREHNEIVDVLKRNGAVDSLKFFARKAKEADARAAAKHNSVHGSMESTDVITNHFLRKVLLSFLMPLGLLLVLNGTWFAVKFLVFTLLYYVVLVAYFVSEITIRPPWYRPNAKKLTMHQLPEYWQGIVNDPKYDLGIDFEDVEFYTSDHTKLSGWFIPAPHRSTVQVPSPTVGVSVESSSSTLWERETGERGSTTTPLVSQKSLATDERESKIKSENDASVKDSFPTTGIVLVHGGGRDRRAFLRHVRMFHEEGFPVLLFDFREHGKSQGSGMGFRYGIKERHDVLAACRYLRRRCTTIRTIVTMGTSVGGSAAIMAAALDSSAIDIVIAENPITTVGYFQHRHVLNVLGGFFQHTKVTMAMFEVFRWFCRKWINLRCGNIPSRKCQAAHVIHKLSPRPVLLMHGTADEVVPMEHSEILFQKAKEPKELWLAPDGFHCGLYDMFPQEFRRRVVTFIRRYENKIPNPGSPRVLASATGSAVSGSFSQPPASAPGRVSPK